MLFLGSGVVISDISFRGFYFFKFSALVVLYL